MEKPDIFDRIMSWRVLRPLRPIYQKYKEPLLYLFFGGLTTLSVDFEQMGRAAGQMVLDARLDRVQCYASLIRRSTF